MHISIGAQHLFDIFGFHVTNTILTSWIVVLFIVCVSIFVGRHMKRHPNGKLAFALEGILTGFINFMSAFAGNKETVRKFLPIVITIFFYVLTSNWAGTLPGVETIGLYSNEAPHGVEESHTTQTEEITETTHTENVVASTENKAHTEETEHKKEDEAHAEEAHGTFLPLFRTVNSDINMTLVFAIIIVIGSHIVGFKTIGPKHHLGKFLVNPFKNPMGSFVGILELIGEVSRIISLTFRLFGNIFAGSVLMLIVSFLAPFIIPIPFLGLELFVGFIQALVISVLAVMFFASATHKHEEH
jgi:F-type H+-transporting ATPase subunit a